MMTEYQIDTEMFQKEDSGIQPMMFLYWPLLFGLT